MTTAEAGVLTPIASGCGRDDDPEPRFPFAKMFFDHAALIPPEMRVMERNTSRKHLAQV
jgi:hypothetical protein